MAEPNPDLVTLYRPVGPAELALLEGNGFSAWPPRLPIQPIFYPVMNERYAREIAERWNVPESGSGAVTAFDVPTVLLERYPVQRVGATHYEELWVPAEELDEFNAAILGPIRVVARFSAEGYTFGRARPIISLWTGAVGCS